MLKKNYPIIQSLEDCSLKNESSAYTFNSNTQFFFSHLFASMLILVIFISKSNKTYSLFLLCACTCCKFIITTLTPPYQRVENRNDFKSSQFEIFVSLALSLILSNKWDTLVNRARNFGLLSFVLSGFLSNPTLSNLEEFDSIKQPIYLLTRIFQNQFQPKE